MRRPRDVLRVQAGASLFDALLIQVGRENLGGYIHSVVRGEFGEGHGQGVGFLTGRASQGPYS